MRQGAPSLISQPYWGIVIGESTTPPVQLFDRPRARPLAPGPELQVQRYISQLRPGGVLRHREYAPPSRLPSRQLTTSRFRSVALQPPARHPSARGSGRVKDKLFSESSVCHPLVSP